jgi:hypothetical protein
MCDQLQLAADHFSLELYGPQVFGWRDRTVGSRAKSGGRTVWLRVSWASPQWADGSYWTGNQDAAGISGVPKPRILDMYDWEGARYRNRAEVMTLVEDPPCSRTPELTHVVDLPDAWWHDLRAALDALATHETDRRVTDQQKVSRRLLAFYGTAADPQVERWTTAHGDLNWSNLTAPTLELLDWESFGVAPAGYDAATLYVLALNAPATARRLEEVFGDVLASPDGVRSQLHVIGRYLKRVEIGDFAEMADLWHAHARRLVTNSGPAARRG